MPNFLMHIPRLYAPKKKYEIVERKSLYIISTYASLLFFRKNAKIKSIQDIMHAFKEKLMPNKKR